MSLKVTKTTKAEEFEEWARAIAKRDSIDGTKAALMGMCIDNVPVGLKEDDIATCVRVYLYSSLLAGEMVPATT
jgi:hypothetical protein